MQGVTGAGTAVDGGGPGSGQPATSSERDRHDRVSGHKTVLSLVSASTGGPASGCRCGPCGTTDNTSCVWNPGSILHASPERSGVLVLRARLVSCRAGLLAFAAGGRADFTPRRRSSVTVGVLHRRARWTGAVPCWAAFPRLLAAGAEREG